MYINVGAKFDDGSGAGPVRVRSKKTLKDALKGHAGDVVFDNTAMTLGNGEHLGGGQAEYRGDEVPEGVSLSVVGPDPYTDRRWYATVQRTATGVTVK